MNILRSGLAVFPYGHPVDQHAFFESGSHPTFVGVQLCSSSNKVLEISKRAKSTVRRQW